MREIELEPDIEEVGYRHGFKYEIVAMRDMGHRCGYITLPDDMKNMQFYQTDLVDAHGGITYQEDNVIGFDCAHHGDEKDFSIMDASSRKWYEDFYKIIGYQNKGKVWTQEDVRKECFNIIDQLLQLQNNAIKGLKP